MQGFLSSWAVSVTIAVLFSAVISSLLPETSIKKYIAVVLGVLVTLFMLSPLFKLLGGVNFEQELKNAVSSMTQISKHSYDASYYRDYIFKVYMGDE
ncbi:MAG: stage III sporulation protein AF [Burkholderiales bacterium]